MVVSKNIKLFDRVYEIVRKIPLGYVATYGQVAEAIGTRDARKIGWALHANKNPLVPCHRVVDKDGRLAPNYAFDGAREQRRRLLEESVNFKDDMHVDLGKNLMKNFSI